jgi:hypothetical protein
LNSTIRNAKADANIEMELAVCEICGHEGNFEDFMWCNPCDVIHCTSNADCITAHLSCDQTLPALFEFTNISHDFAAFCMDKTAEGYEVQACVVTGESKDTDGNGYVSQSFEWLITGAADFNTLQRIIDLLTEDCEYHNLKVIANLKK